MSQQVKDLTLSLLWLTSLLWHGFDPWPKNMQMQWKRHMERPKKKNVFLKEIKQQIVYAYGHSGRLVDEFVSLKIILMLV